MNTIGISSSQIVTTDRQLTEVCARLRDLHEIGLDTEFMRTDTYYGRLCLVQVGSGDVGICIDPLAVDINPLLDIFYAPEITKVLHAARQDLELFVDLRRTPPTRIFDTQIAAGLSGFDEQIGYGPLVAALTDFTLAKSHTRTDWAQRPLPDAALQYAREDVQYLGRLANALRHRLIDLGRLRWAEEDFAKLSEPTLYQNDPAKSYERINAGRSLPPRAQMVLRELAAWREATAQRLNRPRGWIAADHLLVAMARRAPTSVEALASIDGMPPALIRKHATALIATVERGQELEPQVLWPVPRTLTATEQNQLKALQVHVNAVATKLAIAPSLLANRRELTALVLGGSGGRLQRGWRLDVIGHDLQAMCG